MSDGRRNAAGTLLRILNSILTILIMFGVCVAGAYSAYALWDNQQVYAAAGDVQSELLKLKPKAAADGEADTGPSFEELKAINPDVSAWLTMDGTAIDHPILQGETNLSYINTDAFGNFALAGSLFLDARNAPDFSDTYSLIYGHHMADHKMFGDLDLYEGEAFFGKNRTGTLIIPGEIRKLEVIAFLKVPSSENMIFEIGQPNRNISAFLDFTERSALHLNADVLEKARQEGQPRILTLSTCSSEYTDARTILVTLMEPY